MVEGPGCTLNGEKIRRLTGKKLSRSFSTNGVLLAKLQQFAGMTFIGAESLGKELFIYFEGATLCIRLHFGMSGSVHVNGVKRALYNHPPPTPSLLLEFSNENNTNMNKEGSNSVSLVIPVNIYETSVSILEDHLCRAKVVANKSLDVCSPLFSQQRASEEVWKHSGRIVADVLLDQNVLPGSGNIIKNESLFDARVDPNLLVGDLTFPRVQFLVRMTRDFSMLFYNVRKKRQSLQKFMRVYNRLTCGICGAKIVKCRLGKDMSRVTFFCPKCQDRSKLDDRNISILEKGKENIPEVKKTNKQMKSTNGTENQTKEVGLVNWLKNTSKECSMKGKWTCAVCTFINTTSSSNVCGMCGEACVIKVVEDGDTSKPVERKNSAYEGRENLPSFERNTGISGDRDVGGKRKCSLGSSSLSIDDPSSSVFDSSAFEVVHHKGYKFKRRCTETSVKLSPDLSAGILKNSNPTMSTDHTTHVTTDVTTDLPLTCDQDTKSRKSPKLIPKCQHGRACEVRIVRKSDANRGRHFFTCSIPGYNNKCKFFKWADESFPLCKHGARTLLRTVLKQGNNNGRKFYCCSKKKNEQCSFFQWAEDGIVDVIEAHCKHSNINDLG